MYMSLIITNQKTLPNIALVILDNRSTNITEETKGDVTVIKSDSKIVGININNFEKHFKAKEGVHTLDESQIAAIKDLGVEFEVKQSFTIGEVQSKEKHPKSEKLFVLKVMIEKELQIVTNAANAEVGTKVVVARVGTTLPSGTPITFSKVMGVESEGMLCGGTTLGQEPTEGVLLVKGNIGEEFSI